jgi:hypothetical protein
MTNIRLGTLSGKWACVHFHAINTPYLTHMCLLSSYTHSYVCDSCLSSSWWGSSPRLWNSKRHYIVLLTARCVTRLLNPVSLFLPRIILLLYISGTSSRRLPSTTRCPWYAIPWKIYKGHFIRVSHVPFSFIGGKLLSEYYRLGNSMACKILLSYINPFLRFRYLGTCTWFSDSIPSSEPEDRFWACITRQISYSCPTLILRKTVVNLEPKTIYVTRISSFTVAWLKYLHLRSVHSLSLQEFLSPQLSNGGKIITYLCRYAFIASVIYTVLLCLCVAHI